MFVFRRMIEKQQITFLKVFNQLMDVFHIKFS